MPLPAATPPIIPEPFGQNANPLFIRTVPETTSTPGAASYDQGFPALTMQPVVGGGVPPFGQDMNGILFAITAHDYFTQSGQLFPFQSGVAAAIGGYAVGTILQSADGSTIWYNTAANNSTDPDNDGTAAGWIALESYGYLTLSGLTGGNITLTPSQWKRKTIVLVGTLASNLAVILPTTLQTWRIVNATTGAFTTTVRTASGTGVAVAQGGFANPVNVYGDGTNLYPAVAPLGVPISQGPDPSTLLERDNSGNAYAFNFNMSGTESNLGAAEVITTTGDGWLRKNSLANFESQMALSSIGGQVSAGQVPSSAVTQYAALILANAALTGTPTTPTAGTGTSNTQVASTAFANPGASLTTNGYVKLPSGMILQWGQASGGGGIGTLGVSFPIPFPNAILNAGASTLNRTSPGAQGSGFTANWSTGGMTILVDANNSGTRQGCWWAIGF